MNKAWNARSAPAGDTTAVKGDGGNRGVAGIGVSIAVDGQLAAVFVRPNPDFGVKANAEKYELVAGFQRYEAIEMLASGKLADDLVKEAGLTVAEAMGFQTKTPTIRAVVMNLDDVQARKVNIEENTLRNALSTGDLCFAVLELKKANPKITQSEIGVALNNSQGYVGKLEKIGKAIKGVKVSVNGGPEVDMLKAWRESPIKATVAQMEKVADAPEDKRASVYQDALNIRVGASTDAPEGGTDGGPNKWIANSKEAIAKIATMLGHLYFLDVIQVEDNDGLFSPEAIRTLLSPLRELNSKATPAIIDDILAAGAAAFIKAADEGPPVVEEQPSEEEKAAAKEKAKAEKAAAKAAEKAALAKTNGRGVHA